MYLPNVRNNVFLINKRMHKVYCRMLFCIRMLLLPKYMVFDPLYPTTHNSPLRYIELTLLIPILPLEKIQLKTWVACPSS